MASNVISGARSRFKVNGKPVAYAAGVSASESIDFEPVDVLDLLEVREHVPVAYRATLSAQIFRVVGRSLKAVGIFPVEENILTSGDLTCAVEDRLTGETIALFESCRCSEQAWDITARGIVSINTSFVCIRTRDESEIPA